MIWIEIHTYIHTYVLVVALTREELDFQAETLLTAMIIESVECAV
jgi:hypothetical protein